MLIVYKAATGEIFFGHSRNPEPTMEESFPDVDPAQIRGFNLPDDEAPLIETLIDGYLVNMDAEGNPLGLKPKIA